MKCLYSTPTTEPLHCKLALADRPTPILAPNTVIVHVHAAGINPSDSANAFQDVFRSVKPIIPGRDFAGIVQASKSTSFPVGTPVYGTSGDTLGFTQDGTSAEFVLVPEAALAKKPACLSFAQAGAIGVPYTTALKGLQSTCAKAGKDVVLVLGATGAVGSAAVAIARAWGCKVVTASRQDNITDLNVINDPELTRVGEVLGGGKGPDVVIDCVGSAELMRAAMKILEPRGRYALFSAGKDGTVKFELDMLNLYRQSHTICGVSSVAQSPKEVGDMMRTLAVMFEDGSLEGPVEKKLVKVPIEKGVEAYGEALKFIGKKHVIVF